MTSESNSKLYRQLAWGSLVVALVFCAYRLAPSLRSSSKFQNRKIEPLSDENWQAAMSAIEQRDFAPANEFVRQSIGKTGASAQRAMLQGRVFLHNGKLLAASQAFQEAAESPEWNSLAYFWLGATAYKGGNASVAESCWLKALEADPNNVEAHRSLSMFYYDVGAIDHAVQHLQATTGLQADDPRPYRLLGMIFADYERYDEAVGYYRSALSRNLTAQVREEVLRELTNCYLKLRDYKSGLEVIETASKSLDAMVLKADCLVGLGEQDQAIALLDQVLSVDPSNFGAMLSKADANLLAGKAQEAVDVLRRAVAIRSKDYLVNYKLAQALRAIGLTDEAQVVADNAEAIKVIRERFTQLHKDATSSPRDADIRYQLGVTADELGMPEMAAVWYKAAVQLNPSHANAKQKLGFKSET